MIRPVRFLILSAALILLVSGCAQTKPAPEDDFELTPDAPAIGIGSGVVPDDPDVPETDEAGVTEPDIVQPLETTASEPDPEADFYPNGLFIYGDAVYSQVYYSKSNATAYASTALYYQKLFGVPVSVIVAPLSSMIIENPTVRERITDQKTVLGEMESLTDPAVNFVNCFDSLYEHRSEYLFFKSDHHWTQRGAYYAYADFARSRGWEPVALSDLKSSVINEQYNGSMYQMTKDERVKAFTDTIVAYYPTKSQSMTVRTQQGATNTYNSVIVSTNQTYVTYIAGDNPYTVIEVPDNPADKKALVLKDSFGNAFIPFLCEHYGKIIVVDPRYLEENLYDLLKDEGLTDILFINNIEAATDLVWSRLYLGAVGQTLP